MGLRKWKYEQGFTDSDFNWTVQRENDVLAGRLTLPVAPMTEQPAPDRGPLAAPASRRRPRQQMPARPYRRSPPRGRR